MKFSVLMSVYQAEQPGWLASSLDSISSGQHTVPTEIVLIEDGPLTPELYKVIDTFVAKATTPLKRIRLQKNNGLGAALRHGLEACSCDLVARMDADDIAHPHRFKKQLEFMQQNLDIDIVGSFAEDMNENGETIGIRKVPTDHAEMHRLMWTCPLIHPSVMFKKSVILQAGSYSETLKRRQDYDLWFRCAQIGARFANVAEPLIRYRITDHTYTRNSVKVAWNQALIGFNGCRALSLDLKAHIGVFYPVVKAALPLKARKGFERLIKKFDPRGKQ